MLKLVSPYVNQSDNLKCGEIFYETPTNYNVSCCLCGKKQPFDDFTKHFETEHLTPADLDNGPLATGAHLQDAQQLDLPIPTDQADIKCESDDEKPLSMLFPMDETPIDFKDVRMDKRKPTKIIVESLNIKSYKSNEKFSNLANSATENLDFNKNDSVGADDTSFFDLANSTTENLNVNKNNDSVGGDDNTSCFDDNKSTESSDESLLGDFTKETYFPCPQCDCSYQTKRGLNGHVRNKHKNINKPKRKSQQFKCKECDLVFPNEKFLKGHMFKHTGIICDICGKTFSQVGNMNLHKIRHTGVKAHKCADCERCFYTDLELKKHRVCHTRILPVICEVCGRGCRDQSILNAHMRRHTGERPAKCEVCGKCFYSIYDLNVHSVTHSTLRPFKCEVCSSTFQTKKALRVHKKLHSNDRKHVCKICGKSFAQSGGLYSHMKTHDTAEGEQILTPKL